MELSIVIPALNEEETIALVVQKALAVIARLGIAGEVVVADNGSTDGTCRLAQECGARVVSARVPGYGSALQAGCSAAQGRYLVMLDADDSYDVDEVPVFLVALQAGADLVMGNRYRGEYRAGAMPFLHRYLGTPVLTFILNLLFRTGIGDVNCGMRGFSKAAFAAMRCHAAGMEFASEMIIKASLMKLRIVEVPCTLYPDGRGRKPHLRTWSDGWRHLRFMLLFSSFLLFLVPGGFLFLIGLAGLCALPFQASQFDVNHLMTSALLLLTGTQIFGFGLIAKVFSFSEYFDRNDRIVNFIQKHFQLERGLLAGFALVVLSLAILLGLLVTFRPDMLSDISVRMWRFKLGVWGITGMLLGVQVIFTSFLLSLFYLKVK